MSESKYHTTKDGRRVRKGLWYYMNRRKKSGTSRSGKGTVSDEAIEQSSKKMGGKRKLYQKGGKSEFGMLSVKAGYDNNPNPTAADRIVGAKKKEMKKGGKKKMMKYKKGGMKEENKMMYGGKKKMMKKGGKKMMMGGKKKMMGGGMMKKYQSGGFLEPGIPNIDDL